MAKLAEKFFRLVTSHPVVTLFIIALLLSIIRFYNFHSWFFFDDDQQKLATMVKTVVVDHKPLLIGMPTSVGGMFIGPGLIYFLIPFFLLTKMQPTAEIIVVFLNSIFLLWSIGLVGRKIFNLKVGLLAAAIYGLSSLLTIFDRTFWNPTLLALCCLWMFYFLWQYSNNQKTKNIIFAALFCATTFHFHFTALIIFAFLSTVFVLTAIRKKKIDWLGGIFIFVITAASISPLVLFDLRHEFLISTNMVNFLVHGANKTDTIVRYFSIPERIGIFFSILATTIYNNSNIVAEILTGVFIIFLGRKAFWKEKFLNSETKVFYQLFLIFSAIYFVVFVKTNSPFLPYYLLGLFPIWILIIANEFLHLFTRNKITGSILALAFLAVNFPAIVTSRDDLNLFNKQAAVDYVVDSANGESFKVDFVTEVGLKTGFDYLFWLRSVNLVEDQKTKTAKSYKIVIPYTRARANEIKAKFGPYGVVALN